MIDFNDPILKFGDGHIFSVKAGFDPEKPTALIYASCHGRQLFRYLMVHRPEFASTHNILRLETAPMVIYSAEHHSVFDNKTIRSIFGAADILITYSMGSRHGECSLENVRKYMKRDAKVITFVAPNFSCLWPMAYGYSSGIAVLDALDKGKTEDQIWQEFVHGDFEPMFNIRLRIELARLQDKSGYHDVGLVDFIEANIKSSKIWLSSSHPSMITMAYIGNEVLAILGFRREPASKVLSYDYREAETGFQPETDYEFKHYGFAYPIRHKEVAGGLGYYREFLAVTTKFWKEGGRSSSKLFSHND